MASVQSIGIFKEKKAPKIAVDRAELRAGGGIAGDFHESDPERAISLMGAETMAAMAAQNLTGLCTSKFATNIVTEGLDYGALAVGDVLRIGTAAVKLAQVGKECFAQCGMDDRSQCLLRERCAFGVAQTGGTISPGDAIVKA